jgi:hypothetical protein
MSDMRTPPTVFISYSHDSAGHKHNIADVAQSLRRLGIDVRIDLFVEADPPISWADWTQQQIEEADFVLVVVTETYVRRLRGEEVPGVGYGVRWEGSIVVSSLYHRSTDRVKFIPVTVEASDAEIIPAPLKLTNRYHIGQPGARDLEPLVRHLTGQPAIKPEPLGKLVDLSKTTDESSPEELAQKEAIDLASKGDIDGAQEILENQIHAETAPRHAARAAYILGDILRSSEQYMASIIAYRRALDYGAGTGLAEAAGSRLEQVIAEMNAHFGEGSAVEAVQQWLALVQKGKAKKAWAGLERTLRLALAQDWILANSRHPNLADQDWEKLANALSARSPRHRLARPFLASQLAKFQAGYNVYNASTWGAAEKPRRFRLDLELVIFMEAGEEPLKWEPGMRLPAFSFLLKRELAEWKILNFSADIPVPGWPPTAEPLPLDGIDFRKGEAADDE